MKLKGTFSLTSGEFRVGQTLASNPDFTDPDIAAVLGMTRRQVRRHLDNLYVKLLLNGTGRGARRQAADWFKQAIAWPETERQTRIESMAGLRVLIERRIADTKSAWDEQWMSARRTTNHIGRVGGPEADPYWFHLEARQYAAADELKAELDELGRQRELVSSGLEAMLEQKVVDDADIQNKVEEWLIKNVPIRVDA